MLTDRSMSMFSFIHTHLHFDGCFTGDCEPSWVSFACSVIEPLGIIGTGFYGLDILCHPTKPENTMQWPYQSLDLILFSFTTLLPLHWLTDASTCQWAVMLHSAWMEIANPWCLYACLFSRNWFASTIQRMPNRPDSDIFLPLLLYSAVCWLCQLIVLGVFAQVHCLSNVLVFCTFSSHFL